MCSAMNIQIDCRALVVCIVSKWKALLLIAYKSAQPSRSRPQFMCHASVCRFVSCTGLPPSLFYSLYHESIFKDTLLEAQMVYFLSRLQDLTRHNLIK